MTHGNTPPHGGGPNIGPAPKGLVHRAKIGRQTKKVDFFKVGDTLTMIYLGEKKHLSDVSSWLKTFYDHLRGYRDNLKILDFCILVTGVTHVSCTNAYV